jgi:spermidine synthase
MLPPDGDGPQVVHGDASEFMARHRGQRDIDVLPVDACDASVERPALDTEDFYANCRACLREDATVAVNLIGRDLDVRASVSRIRRELRPRALCRFPPTEAGNVVVIAHGGDVPREDVLAARAADIARRWELPAPEWLAMVRRTPGGE